jgi:transposase
VLQLVREGLNRRAIAARLGISVAYVNELDAKARREAQKEEGSDV